MLQLLEAGDLRPTTERIAEVAGVSTRSIFLHFADVDRLFTEAIDRFTESKLRGLRPVPVDLPLDERIGVFAKHRTKLYESITFPSRAAHRQEPLSKVLQQRMRSQRRRSRKEIERVFADELDGRSPDERREILEALCAAASWNTWETLRRHEGLSRARAERIVVRSLSALLRS
ncbi:MAG: TetR/AcrR family transcriptional regulator [Myxococcota bacterium]|nr:TetR/AcrR family transcriptional regulator [Myxococcota bacterium]